MPDETDKEKKPKRLELTLENVKYILLAGTLVSGGAGVYTSTLPINQPSQTLSQQYNRKAALPCNEDGAAHTYFTFKSAVKRPPNI